MWDAYTILIPAIYNPRVDDDFWEKLGILYRFFSQMFTREIRCFSSRQSDSRSIATFRTGTYWKVIAAAAIRPRTRFQPAMISLTGRSATRESRQNWLLARKIAAEIRPDDHLRGFVRGDESLENARFSLFFEAIGRIEETAVTKLRRVNVERAFEDERRRKRGK